MRKEKKEAMWYKIQELNEERYSKSQISRNLKIDRETVSKYLKMSKEDFDKIVKHNFTRDRKLSKYYKQVETMLKECEDLSSAQIEDRLKENNHNFEEVSTRTIFNFVQHVRERSNIPKPKGRIREYEKVLELAYGHQGQCDFGSFWMRKIDDGKKRVHFMVMVLSRSRAKYVKFQSKPFTTVDAIEAHKSSFEYYGGCPKEIWYDQDRVFAVDENYGDFKFTEEFKKYLKDENFEAKFCKKADPESKGKVENVVKYVKGNFLKGRKYISEELLQEQSDNWLDRTANVKKHEGTKLVPIEELKLERPYLRTPKNSFQMPEINGIDYNVRKDNTICYKSNYYTVPTGTYQCAESKVEVKQENGILNIFDINRCLIASHYVSVLKGKTISKSDHRRDKTTSLKEKIEIVSRKLNDELCNSYLQKLVEKKPRYIHDELNHMLKLTKEFSDRELKEGIHEAIKLEIYNSNDIKYILTSNRKNENAADGKIEERKEEKEKVSALKKYEGIQATKSKMSDFETIINPINLN